MLKVSYAKYVGIMLLV